MSFSFFTHFLSLAHRKCVLALHQCNNEGNTRLHQALGPTSCSFPAASKWVPPSVCFLKGAREWEMFASLHSLHASMPCFSQCRESTQRCCIPLPSRWWSFRFAPLRCTWCYSHASPPGSVCYTTCPPDTICPSPEHLGKQEAGSDFLHGYAGRPSIFHRQPDTRFGLGLNEISENTNQQ